MREIKFRAWAKPGAGVGVGMSEPFSLSDISYTIDDDGIHFGDDVVSFDIESDFELMQFTGLKDKNGKEIYEGDVLKDPAFPSTGFPPLVVEYEPYLGGWNPFANTTFSPRNLEVIGNVWENPELLKGAKP